MKLEVHLLLTETVGDSGQLHLQEDIGELTLVGGLPPAGYRGHLTTELVVGAGQTDGGVDIEVDVVRQLQQDDVVLQSSLLVVEVLVNNVVSHSQGVLGQKGLPLQLNVMVSQGDLNCVDIAVLKWLSVSVTDIRWAGLNSVWSSALKTQWAALTTYLEEMRVPPQNISVSSL